MQSILYDRLVYIKLRYTENNPTNVSNISMTTIGTPIFSYALKLFVDPDINNIWVNCVARYICVDDIANTANNVYRVIVVINLSLLSSN